jgi:hypothetical protein
VSLSVCAIRMREGGYQPVHCVQKPPDAATLFALFFGKISRAAWSTRMRSVHVFHVELTLCIVVIWLGWRCYRHFLAEFEFPGK